MMPERCRYRVVLAALSFWALCVPVAHPAATATSTANRLDQRELDRAEILLRGWLTDLPPDSGVAIERDDDHITLRFSTRWVFDADSAVLKSDAGSSLPVSAALRLLKRRRLLCARIFVYTDTVGGESANQSFAAARAKTLYGLFTSQGIAAARLQQQGAGSGDALSNNDIPEGRMQNRRVEMTFARAGR
jgi:outer membrane protein OmpA-like peptidoglycan-associated protein